MDPLVERYCLACLSQFNNMRNVKEIWSGELTFLNLIDSFLGFNWNNEKANFLCLKCEIRLIDSYLFKKQCIESANIRRREIKEEEISNNLDVNGPSNDDMITICDEAELIKDKISPDVSLQKHNCLKCKLKLASYKEYQEHYRKFHRKKHICSECGKLVARHNLEKHKRCHLNPEHVCDECGKAFTLIENLKKHIRIHTKDYRYECEFCKKKFIHWNSKQCHIRSQHTGEKKYICTVCDKKFAHSSNMLRHMRYHTGELHHECSYCSKKFNTTSELKNHIVTHTKEKNKLYEICTKSFGTRKALKTHLKVHRGERDYMCPVCMKAYAQPHGLKTHLKIHPEYLTPPAAAILSKRHLQNKVVLE